MTKNVSNSVGLGKEYEDAMKIGQGDTAKTQIGDSGSSVVVAKRKPNSLLSQAGAVGDKTGGVIGSAASKPLLGS